ncbi:endonuclease/exonuclease/phosphatase family protein [Leptolyngbya sp. FACHB-261]|uniref:endonuclease/exonuclease/phosphatase family protein n=1 Tax=Leptolyngbya sp. FACHB-261 TaxID=2692806 RepID=UPI00168401C9|nr:endonuclease/exonuclease/phosphatase family protein [Leptolyngbya sp. FACHB-261]MBD2101833.1 endonuclease/exonuclease/phosphatase family protein [Leptolyngbya sp. FACHB-261]
MRILTLNIQNYQDEVAPWHERRERICRLIKSLNPDVIALQAVRHDPAVEPVHQAEQLQQQLTDYPHSFWQGTTPHSTSSWDGSQFCRGCLLPIHPKCFC